MARSKGNPDAITTRFTQRFHADIARTIMAEVHMLHRRSRHAHAIQPSDIVFGAMEYLVARKVIGRLGRIGGIKGALVSAAATYAINRLLASRRRR